MCWIYNTLCPPPPPKWVGMDPNEQAKIQIILLLEKMVFIYVFVFIWMETCVCPSITRFLKGWGWTQMDKQRFNQNKHFFFVKLDVSVVDYTIFGCIESGRFCNPRVSAICYLSSPFTPSFDSLISSLINFLHFCTLSISRWFFFFSLSLTHSCLLQKNTNFLPPPPPYGHPPQILSLFTTNGSTWYGRKSIGGCCTNT